MVCIQPVVWRSKTSMCVEEKARSSLFLRLGVGISDVEFSVEDDDDVDEQDPPDPPKES